MLGASSSSVVAGSSQRTREIYGTAIEVDPNVQILQELFSHFRFQCSDPKCSQILPLKDGDEHIEAWRITAQQIPPSSQLSELACECGKFTCVGCGCTPVLNKDHHFTSLGVINNCCDKGRLFSIWAVLARFDESELPAVKELSSASSAKNTKKKSKNKSSHLSAGVGYASEYGAYYDTVDTYDDLGFLVPGMIPFAGFPQTGVSKNFKFCGRSYVTNLKSPVPIMTSWLPLYNLF